MITVHAGHGNEFRIHPRIFTAGCCDHLIPVNVSPHSLVVPVNPYGTLFPLLQAVEHGLAADAFIQINHHSPSWHFVPFKLDKTLTLVLKKAACPLMVS